MIDNTFLENKGIDKRFFEECKKVSSDVVENKKIILNFDELVKKHFKGKNQRISSTDTIIENENSIYFCEFKDIKKGKSNNSKLTKNEMKKINKIFKNNPGRIKEATKEKIKQKIKIFFDKKTNSIKFKICESILFFLKFIDFDEKIRFFKKKKIFYLIYKSESENQYIKRHINSLESEVKRYDFFLDTMRIIESKTFEEKFLK